MDKWSENWEAKRKLLRKFKNISDSAMKTQPLLSTVNSRPTGRVRYLEKKVRQKCGALSRTLPKLENLVEYIISKVILHQRIAFSLKYVSSYKIRTTFWRNEELDEATRGKRIAWSWIVTNPVNFLASVEVSCHLENWPCRALWVATNYVNHFIVL